MRVVKVDFWSDNTLLSNTNDYAFKEPIQG